MAVILPSLSNLKSGRGCSVALMAPPMMTAPNVSTKMPSPFTSMPIIAAPVQPAGTRYPYITVKEAGPLTGFGIYDATKGVIADTGGGVLYTSTKSGNWNDTGTTPTIA